MAKGEMKDVFGLGTDIVFSDGKKRRAYPVSMRNFGDFVEAFSNLNYNTLWMNFLIGGEDNTDYIKKVFSLTFKDEKDLDALFDVVTAQDWKKIMQSIMDINDIKIKVETEETGNPQQGEE